MKVLNLYAGIGGNRKLWKDVEVTAVEIDKKIAKIYQDFFPNDEVIVTDAHKYLLDMFAEFDFIWSSPPCPTHSNLRFGLSYKVQGCVPVFPDMKLYEEIIFLKYYFKGKWVVENVNSYYEPLIKPFEIGRHYFWANFIIGNKKIDEKVIRISLKERENNKGFNLDGYKLDNKIQVINNCVNSKLGLHILQEAIKEKQQTIEDFSE
ncbi:unnamed protein product [marine sediment metagenome]|uniref:DNA (cytosine-5-)-methyltransferase n=1 Tax=marine sediment metagenome TaxID=412755 RepID=X0SAV4_9ZZZZ